MNDWIDAGWTSADLLDGIEPFTGRRYLQVYPFGDTLSTVRAIVNKYIKEGE